MYCHLFFVAIFTADKKGFSFKHYNKPSQFFKNSKLIEEILMNYQQFGLLNSIEATIISKNQ